MKETKKHFYKKWEVSIIELDSAEGKKYKVTRMLPELHAQSELSSAVPIWAKPKLGFGDKDVQFKRRS